MRQQPYIISAPYPYQPGMPMMPTQGWGVMPQPHFGKSTAAARQSAQRIRKRSEGEIHTRECMLYH